MILPIGQTGQIGRITDHQSLTTGNEGSSRASGTSPSASPTTEWSTEEFVRIAAEQSRREEEAARAANRVLICDTDAFATAIWHRRYVGRPSPEVEAIAARQRHHLYLLTGDEIPFTQDGLRDGEHLRHWMHGVFEEELTATGRPWALVRGTYEERMARATAEIDRMLVRP